MQNKVLLIMPSRNRESIIKAVESVKNQTDDRWHLCIVYDCIKDEPKIQETENITCIYLDRKLGVGQNGAGNVRNKAINLLSDQYQWNGFIDDDDELDENYVSLLFSRYANNDLVIFRMKRALEIFPPFGCTEILPGKVGISFCYRNPVNTRFKPGYMEDFQFLQDLQKEKEIQYTITQEIGYYVGNPRYHKK